MRLVCISDTHGLHGEMPSVPPGDVVIHAGDCLRTGSLAALEEFTRWFGNLPHKHKMLIAGNHDFCFERQHDLASKLCKENGITYLQDESTVIDGLTFYGSPWTPVYRKMAFTATEEQMFELRARIPDHTNVLITHGPALGILDFVPHERAHVGCFPLLKRMDQLLSLTAHIFGHIHESYGFAVRESDGVKFANASTCDVSYRPINPPIIIDLQEAT